MHFSILRIEHIIDQNNIHLAITLGNTRVSTSKTPLDIGTSLEGEIFPNQSSTAFGIYHKFLKIPLIASKRRCT